MTQAVKNFFLFLSTERSASPNTISAYQTDLKMFCDYLNGTPPEKATEKHVKGFLESLKDRQPPYAAVTIERKISAIRSFFLYLEFKGEMAVNPTKWVLAPRAERTPIQALTSNELELLISQATKKRSAIGLRDKAILGILYGTGLRASELCGLNLEDVYLPETLGVALDISYVQIEDRYEKIRVIPFANDLAVFVLGYLIYSRPKLVKRTPSEPRCDGKSAFFVNRRGGRLTRQGLWLILTDYAREAGITKPVTPEIIRHSYAVHMLSNGADLTKVQQYLGHAKTSTTKEYIQIQDLSREATEVQ